MLAHTCNLRKEVHVHSHMNATLRVHRKCLLGTTLNLRNSDRIYMHALPANVPSFYHIDEQSLKSSPLYDQWELMAVSTHSGCH